MKKLFIVSAILLGWLFSNSMPDWVSEMPTDTSFYWARENVSIRGLDPGEYKLKANQQALVTLSSQIRSEVSGFSIDEFRERNGQVEDDFVFNSYFSTISDIEGSEKVDDYLTATTYFVLWKLNKKKHRDASQQHLEFASAQYEFFLGLEDNEPLKQLQSLVPAYEDMMKVVGKDNIIYGDGINLKAVIPAEIKRIVNSLKLSQDGATKFIGRTGWGIDDPLKIRIKSSKKNVSVENIPIRFHFYEGEGSFSNRYVLTKKNGKAKTEITKIISRLRFQRIKATIDLNQMRESRSVGSSNFQRELENISKMNSLNFEVDVSEVTQEKIAIITVGDTSIYDESDLKRLNRRFRSDFSNITQFKLTDESIIESIIEKYKRSATLCSNEQCQIDIGNALKVKELIFVDIADYPKQVAATIFLRNIGDGELKLEKTYYFEHNGKLSKNEKLNFIDNNITEMVEDFWVRYNPAILSIMTNIRGSITAEFTLNNPTKWMEKVYDERLPLYNKEIFEGDYFISISDPRYESIERNFIASRGEFDTLRINLVEKTPAKAFWKSMIIPGRGQFYSSSVNNKSRSVIGYAFLAGAAGATALMGSAWGEYSAAKNDYDDANQNYLKQKLIEEVQVARSIAEQKNSLMLEKQSTALIITGVWGLVWLGSAFEAMYNFPRDGNRFGSQSNGFNLALGKHGHEIYSRLQYNIAIE